MDDSRGSEVVFEGSEPIVYLWVMAQKVLFGRYLIVRRTYRDYNKYLRFV